MTDEEVIKWVRKTQYKDWGKSFQKMLDDDKRFADFIRTSFKEELMGFEDPRG